MGRVKSFRPEWGYVPAANGFSRTIHLVLVATAIAATAGSGVVLSLVDVASGQASVAAHSVAAPVQALISVPEAAQPKPQSIVEFTMDLGANGRSGAAASESSANPNIAAPTGTAPLTEVGPNDASVKVATRSWPRRAGGEQSDQEAARCPALCAARRTIRVCAGQPVYE